MIGMRAALVGETMPPGQLMGAMSVQRTTMGSARIAGALTGAGLVAALGIGPAYTVVTCLYVTSVILTRRTAAGTQLVRDIAPGGASSDPSELTSWNGQLAFSAFEPTRSRELWITDGSDAGTRVLHEPADGTASGNPYWLTVLGDALYFTITGSSGQTLWRSDPASSEPKLVREQITSRPRAIGDALYFTAFDQLRGAEPWISNGTVDGTRFDLFAVYGAIPCSGGGAYDLNLTISGER